MIACRYDSGRDHDKPGFCLSEQRIHIHVALRHFVHPSRGVEQLRRDLMIPILSHRIQEQAFGSLTASSRARLRQLGRAFEADANSAITAVPGIKPGTRLVRQWRGQVHLVSVEAKGYEYQGASYQSLSEIARLITGARWSGPLFFGLKGKDSKEAK